MTVKKQVRCSRFGGGFDGGAERVPTNLGINRSNGNVYDFGSANTPHEISWNFAFVCFLDAYNEVVAQARMAPGGFRQNFCCDPTDPGHLVWGRHTLDGEPGWEKMRRPALKEGWFDEVNRRAQRKYDDGAHRSNWLSWMREYCANRGSYAYDDAAKAGAIRFADGELGPRITPLQRRA
jgi:hypothetical protein